jgi:hypothetical protein
MGNWGKAWALIAHSLKAFWAYPILIVPLLLAWVAYAAVILGLKYGWQPSHLDASFAETAGVVFAAIFTLSLSTLLACDMVLEMIRHIEEGEPSLTRAAADVLGRDFLRVALLSLVWAVIWFTLTIIEALLSKRRGNDDSNFNAENAAKTLAGYGEFSLTGAFFEALQKGVRMVVFLVLPAIAWDNLGLIGAAKKGLAVLKAHLGDFARGYALTYAAAGVVFLPPAIMFKLGTGNHGHAPLVQFSAEAWVGLIIYIGLAWSFCMYLEQLFMAQLYLWHQKWEAAAEAARRRGEPVPNLHEVEQPLLLAKVPNLLD